MAYSSLLYLSICFLVLFHGCLAQSEQVTGRSQRPQQQRFQTECRINNLNAREPAKSFEAEAGLTEYWTPNDEQFRCAGVDLVRHTIQCRGLLLPSFSNAPKLIYVVQGRGLHGAAIPGCPETFQSELHQKVHQIQEGDILAVPTRIAHWIYNDGESQLILVELHDTSNQANQLDENARSWQGSRSRSQSQGQELVMRIQNRDDRRGRIVLVEDALRVLSPQSRGEEREERGWDRDNGVEETFCTLRLKHNIADPQRADVYNERGGRITKLTSLNLPILRYIQPSAERGVLYTNALVAPHYNMNCHTVIYVIRGNARLRVVGENGKNDLTGMFGKLVAFKTNHNAEINPLAGRLSAMRAFPEDVLINAYRIDMEEARRLKYNREETTLFSSESFGWQHRN
ncbi:hypothetical protein I3760_01G180900 [Carya illinoinensis]|nr:hypothetical protein I3760_01G180900 [Carya illinoinensis]